MTVLLDPGARPAHGDMAYGRTLRLALRDLRGGLRGFAVFISCIALGVGAIAAVGSFSRSLADGLAHQGREILGGDVAFTLIQRAATPSERTFMASRGALSAVATMRALVRGSEGRPALVELKAVDRAYPLYGAVVTEPAGSLSDLLASRDGAFGAVADPALLTRLGIAPGARLTLGEAPITITATLSAEPDKLADGIGFGPRLLISAEALQATGLLQPGSLVRWRYRLRLPAGSSEDAEAKAVMDAATDQFPQAGWEMRSRANAAPQLERSIERFTQYMALVGMTALLIGGIGVANSARHYLDRKRDVIATMKAIGATGTRIVTLYLIEVLVIAAIGTAIGVGFGAMLPLAVTAAFGDLIPLPLAPSIYPDALAAAALDGMLIAVVFALWPLGRAHDVPVAMLFRDTVAPQRRLPRRRYVVAVGLAAFALAFFVVAAAFDRKIALIFIGAAVAVFGVLRLTAAGLMAFARVVPRPRVTIARIAIANIHRPGALTPTVVLSLGLGLAPGHGTGSRRKSSPAVRGGAAGQGTLLLFHRYPLDPGHALCRFHPRRGADGAARTGSDVAWAHRQRARGRRRRSHAQAGCRLGTAKRPRHYLYGRDAGRLAARGWAMVGRGLFRTAGGVARKAGRAGTSS